MKLIRLGAAVLNQTPLAWDANKRNILDAIASARSAGVSLLCLPELAITGYGCEDAFYSPGVHGTALAVLDEIAPATEDMIVAVGLPLFFRKSLYNTACLLANGRIAGFVGKRFLPGGGIYYEPRWFKAWPEGVRTRIEIADRDVPLGDYLFDCGDVRIGFEICEDAWVAARPGSQLALKGADVILNPSASHFAFGRQEIRRRYVAEGSRAFGVAYVYANLLGNEAGRIIYDGGALIANVGSIVASGRRFSFRDVELTSAVVDIEADRTAQAQTGSYRPELSEDRSGIIEIEFEFPELEPAPPPATEPTWEDGPHLREEEFARAVSLGLFDYMRKSHSSGFVVSLSGGADSSAVACLVALMVAFASQVLGLEGLLAKLGQMPAVAGVKNARELVGRLLLCVYQATQNSSEMTRRAAHELTAAIGASFLELDVDGLVRDYVGLVEAAIGRDLSWERDDVALQNIQARVRGPGAWLLANLRGALLLATSNRSEAAVGYATMDGDTCGGLSPIAGIDKAFLRRWLKWLEHQGPAGLQALPALAAVNAQQPTAELRPLAASQTDESDLMPYELLDAIEGAAIRDKHDPHEVYLEMRARFPDYDSEQLYEYVARFFRLWCQNQWKRERYAPSFHLDDKNLDPKSWCRFPILSGGYERELAELRAYVDRHEPSKR